MAFEVIDVEQGSEEWHRARMGIPTTSEFKSVLGKTWGDDDPKMRRWYMLRLIGERITGEPSDFYRNDHMERGKAMEPEARRMYEFLLDAECVRIGFLRKKTRGGFLVGCSPDSFIGDRGMLEIKTKLPHLHLDVVLRQKVPSEHYAQCQGALWIAERDWIDFESYWPKMDPFIHRLYRDEPYIDGLERAVDEFCYDMARIEDMIRSGKVTSKVSTGGKVTNPLQVNF